jgi:hypothetical protein
MAACCIPTEGLVMRAEAGSTTSAGTWLRRALFYMAGFAAILFVASVGQGTSAAEGMTAGITGGVVLGCLATLVHGLFEPPRSG